jgi:hypothetical protein
MCWRAGQPVHFGQVPARRRLAGSSGKALSSPRPRRLFEPESSIGVESFGEFAEALHRGVQFKMSHSQRSMLFSDSAPISWISNKWGAWVLRNLAAVMNWNDGLELDMAGSSRMNLNAVSRLEEYDISETIWDHGICFFAEIACGRLSGFQFTKIIPNNSKMGARAVAKAEES